jgi:hypothetical protein
VSLSKAAKGDIIKIMESPEHIKQTIKVAFEGVTKGQGIGLQEATAFDNRATEEDRLVARKKDVEEQWWDVVEEWDGQLGTALSFTDKDGFTFLLPATMYKALDGSFDNTNSVQFHLCISKVPYVEPPHHGHPEYTDYLRSLHPKDWVEYFEFTPKQIHAVALFLQWADDDRGNDRELELRKHSHEGFLKHANPGDYILSWEDVLNNYREERRILKEWLELGRVYSE